MTVLNAHFDGKRIVLDEPMPVAVPPNTQVRVIVVAAEGQGSPTDDSARPQSLQEIANLATDADLPRDFSTQHAHYTKGFARR